MIKLTLLGTCSGTEPMPNRHHCSLVFEINDKLYWFDAGENCSHKAYTSGIDVSKVRAVFISHMHIDHIGGLANLIFTIYKRYITHKTPHINDNSYDIFVPDIERFQHVTALVPAHKISGIKMIEHEVKDGVVFEDEDVKITALHNTHLNENGENGWHSYSYLIEAEGKKIVYSGDVGASCELDMFVNDGCDLLIHETGHHKVADVCEYAKSRGVKRLLFNHHGREILRGREDAEKIISDVGINAKICDDGDEEII